MHSLSPGSNYHIHTITYILLFLGQIICSRNSCHSRKYLVISALVIGSREIIPEHFKHVTHAQACTAYDPTFLCRILFYSKKGDVCKKLEVNTLRFDRDMRVLSINNQKSNFLTNFRFFHL